MKNLALTVAIIYTAVLAMMIMTTDDIDTLTGCLFLSVPTVVNWVSWNKFKQIEANEQRKSI